MNWRDVERAHRWFDRHGIAFVLTGRLVPTVRSLISIPAGLLDMRFRNFMLASTVGTAIWTTFLTLVGMKLEEEFSSIDQVLGPISTGVLVALVLIYVVRLARHKGA